MIERQFVQKLITMKIDNKIKLLAAARDNLNVQERGFVLSGFTEERNTTLNCYIKPL